MSFGKTAPPILDGGVDPPFLELLVLGPLYHEFLPSRQSVSADPGEDVNEALPVKKGLTDNPACKFRSISNTHSGNIPNGIPLYLEHFFRNSLFLEEYMKENLDGYRQSRFYELYAQWKKKADVVMRSTH